jgi:hypothetical protein
VCSAATPGSVDCTAALTAKAGAPALHTVIVPVGYNFAGCNLLTVTTASKQTGLNDATGIGWYASDVVAGNQSMSNGTFVPSAALKQVGTAPLKGGVPGVQHQFAGVANCTVGQASYDKLFKPYMQFDNAPDGNTYRNWDRSANYRISRAAPQFDRSGDVLGP